MKDVNFRILPILNMLAGLYIYYYTFIRNTSSEDVSLSHTSRLSNVLIDVATLSRIGWGNSFTVVDVLKVPFLFQQ